MVGLFLRYVIDLYTIGKDLSDMCIYFDLYYTNFYFFCSCSVYLSTYNNRIRKNKEIWEVKN